MRNSRSVQTLSVSALYGRFCVENTKQFRAREFGELEDEMFAFGAEGFRELPDRVDALVWAVWALMLDEAALGVRQL